MWRRWIVAILGGVLLAGAAEASRAQTAVVVDAHASWAGFSLRTRWGHSLDGHFREMQGEIIRAGNERRQVRVRLATTSVEIIGSERFTRMTRGDSFFDSDNHPEVVFVSDPYLPALLKDGGKLAGDLTIRGHTRREVFNLEPSTCDRPAIDCDVFATGVVYRGDFDMGRWSVALSDRVRLTLRLRTRGAGAGE